MLARLLGLAVFVCCALGAGADQVYVAGFAAKKLYSYGSGGQLKSIPLAGNPLDLALTEDGEFLYVSLPSNESIAVIRTADDSVTGAIPLRLPPAKMAIGNAGTRLYVAHDATVPPHVTVIDISTSAGKRANIVCGSIDTHTQGADSAFAVGTFGESLAVGTRTGHVLLYDTSVSPPAFVSIRKIGSRVRHVVFSPFGGKLYVLLGASTAGPGEDGRPTLPGNLHVLRVPGLALKSVLALGSGGLRSAAIAGASHLYATDVRGGVHDVDIGGDTLVHSASLGGMLAGIAASGDRLFVVDSARDLIEMLLARSLERQPGANSIPLDPHAAPTALVVSPPKPPASSAQTQRSPRRE